jgi:hypothetical protein
MMCECMHACIYVCMNACVHVYMYDDASAEQEKEELMTLKIDVRHIHICILLEQDAQNLIRIVE